MFTCGRAPRAFELLGISLATLAVATLAHTLAVFGYGFQRLIEATGPVRAALILLGLAALHVGLTPTFYETPEGTRLLVTMLATMLLCLCWFRTHGLWMAWGLHFAWAAVTGVVFGLPLGGDLSFASVVDMRTAGTDFGSRAATTGRRRAMFSMLGVDGWRFRFWCGSPAMTMRGATRAPPIIPAGYDVTIAPPAAHVAMEQAVAVHSPLTLRALVQILPTTPQTPSADGSVEQALPILSGAGPQVLPILTFPATWSPSCRRREGFRAPGVPFGGGRMPGFVTRERGRIIPRL
jgi:hypothetical protein